jgi:hypothetical protein
MFPVCSEVRFDPAQEVDRVSEQSCTCVPDKNAGRIRNTRIEALEKRQGMSAGD